ncbi:5-keto-4-deoxy-D-glucarate aldolase [compost metagenome]
MGFPDNPDHPVVQEKIREVVDAVLRAGKVCGILAPREEDARRYREWGCGFIAVGIDICLLRQAALENLQRYTGERCQEVSRTY